MKTALVLSAIAISSLFNTSFSVAHADGFLCQAANTGIQIKIYNHTDAAAGTRTPAIMVVSDPSLAEGAQTIASFSDANRDLQYNGKGNYSANVDLRFSDSSNQSAIIGGTTLGQMKTLEVAINFSYNAMTTVLASVSTSIPGQMIYHLRSGEINQESLSCTRYLKGGISF
jgi:hypothetical protein